ncbi:Uu.00g131680.m01.CDS01 [Anthostomella pinea]|uniref:Uu.00g131680.m01.CDS01 n=1 Tax=Anthostomella pinea TaxID=933095 RepID=A0AAI8YIA1_9PEZI|nr:Uu.00g131680.m01.CDS01 [Anthostomella pinea]
MATPSTTSAIPMKNNVAYNSDSDSDGQARGGRRPAGPLSQTLPQLPTSGGLAQPAGQLLRGATDEQGNQKSPALLVGIKLDLEAEVHLTARVRGDICIGLY